MQLEMCRRAEASRALVTLVRSNTMFLEDVSSNQLLCNILSTVLTRNHLLHLFAMHSPPMFLHLVHASELLVATLLNAVEHAICLFLTGNSINGIFRRTLFYFLCS